MALEAAFTVANLIAMIGWLLLLIAPNWKATRLGLPLAISFLLALAYIALAAVGFPKAIQAGGGFGSLEQVEALLGQPAALLAGWIHYLAFDLFVGSWIAADALRQGFHRLATAPVLVLTFLAGPAGLALYFLMRATICKKLTVEIAGGAAHD